MTCNNVQSIKRFCRSVRGLMRHTLMQGHRYPIFMDLVRRCEWWYLAIEHPPRFLLDKMDSIVRSALRMVESGRHPRKLYGRLFAYLLRWHRLFTRGIFCGENRPMLEDTFCSICQSGDAGEEKGGWWISRKCEPHHFHVECLFTNLAFDHRCPLCRKEV